MTTWRLFPEKLGGTSATSFVGDAGEIFYDPASTTLRISDGSTPGGTSLLGGGGTDSQTLSLVGDTLSITNGNSVDLSKYIDTANFETELATTTVITEIQDGTGWNLPGPYVNESAAATAGVSVGQAYYDNGGTVRVRLV